jgi:tight adherence protein B
MASTTSCSKHSISKAPEVHEHILLAALGSTILLGVALFWMLGAKRRKAVFEPRLRAIVIPTSSPDTAMVSLRRTRPAHRAVPDLFFVRLDAALAATGDRIGLTHLVATGSLVTATVVCIAAVMGTPPGLSIALAGAAALGAPILLVQFAQSRYQRRFLDCFPDALDLIVRAVRAGLPFLEAVEIAARDVHGPVGIEFERMLGEIRIGVEMGEALQHATARVRVPDFRFFVVSLLVQRQTGGGIAETLANLSGIIRQRRALRIKARALTAEATASAALVATMPFIAGLGLFFINREVMSILFIDPRGRFMLGFAIVSLLLGIAVMKAMIIRSLR